MVAELTDLINHGWRVVFEPDSAGVQCRAIPEDGYPVFGRGEDAQSAFDDMLSKMPEQP